jgi:hypothetical protein
MAIKHSRKGLAVGISLAMGVSTFGVLPAQAVGYQNLDLSIAQEDTNGVLATTMENDFELTLDWNLSDSSDLAYLTYDVTVVTADGSDADVYGGTSGLDWDATNDNIDTWDAPFYDWTDNTFEDGDSFYLEAPAHVIGDDEVATYRRTVTSYDPAGDICGITSTTSDYNINEVPNDSTGTGCTVDASTGISTIEYRFESGYVGSLDEPAPSGFQSTILLAAVSSDDYVDLVVNAFLDVNGNGVKDLREHYSAPKTVRFWNPNSLTPVLTLADSGKAWYESAGDTVSVDTETYVSQELNNVYTTELSDVNNNWTVVNDQNYDNTRDGYIYVSGVGSNYKAALSTFAIDDQDVASADAKYSKKHLYLAKTLNADQGDVNRFSVIDANQTDSDTFFNEDSDNVQKIVSGPQTLGFVKRTVKDVAGLATESNLVVRDGDIGSDSGDAMVHDSVKSLTYSITLLDQVVSGWSDFGTEEDSEVGVAGVDVVITGSYNDNDDRGALSVNGTSILDATSNATKVDGSFEIEATSNSAGQVVLQVAVGAPIDGLDINFETITAQGVTFDVDDQDDNAGNLYFEASYWYLVDELNSEDSSVGSADSLRTVTVGASTAIKYNVVDQFYQSPANGVARVQFYSEGYLSDARDFGGFFDGDVVSNVVNGAVTVSVPDADATAGEGTIDVTAYLYTKNANGSWSYAEDYWSEDTTRIEYVTDAAVATIEQDDSTASEDIAYVGFTTGDSELVRWTDAMDAINSNGSYDYLDGWVRNADGLGLAGVKVTATAADLQFVDGYDWQLFGAGTLTIVTDENGYYEFGVYGHTVGAHTVTITAGGKSATAKYTVTAGNVRAHNVAITSAFAAKAGTADALTALVTDRYGNVAAGKTVTFSKVSGSGYIQTPATATTDSKGVAAGTLIILGGEVGFDSTVLATITQEAFYATGNAKSAQRSAGDTNLGKTSAWTQLQADGTVKMYAKNIVGVGKVQLFHNGSEIAWVRAADALNPKLSAANGSFYIVRTRNLVAGKNVFEIYIDGERVARSAYSKK